MDGYIGLHLYLDTFLCKEKVYIKKKIFLLILEAIVHFS